MHLMTLRPTSLHLSLLALPLLLSSCATTPEPEEKASPAPASEVRVNPASAPATTTTSIRPAFRKNAPMIYTVQKGDTLWALAQRFLNNPADWKKIWYANPQVRNPNLIFPGDQLEIVTINGQQRLTQRITPHVRISPLDHAIPTLPLEALKAFLTYPQIIEVPELNDTPRIVGSPSDRLILGGGDRFYALGSTLKPDALFAVVRPHKTLLDPFSGEVLGYETEAVGLARVLVNDDPATLLLIKANIQAKINDRLVGLPPVLTNDLELLPPREGMSGVILSLPDKNSRTGQWQIVAISMGRREGVEPGQVLRIFQSGKDSRIDTTPIVDERAVQDASPFPPNDGKPPVIEMSSSADFSLPAIPVGDAVVFLAYERVSYVLITQTTRAVKIGDCVGASAKQCAPL